MMSVVSRVREHLTSGSASHEWRSITRDGVSCERWSISRVVQRRFTSGGASHK